MRIKIRIPQIRQIRRVRGIRRIRQVRRIRRIRVRIRGTCVLKIASMKGEMFVKTEGNSPKRKELN